MTEEERRRLEELRAILLDPKQEGTDAQQKEFRELLEQSLKTYHFGGKLQVKDRKNGIIEGVGVRYSSHADPDLEAEYFEEDTYLGRQKEFDLYYGHGFDDQIGGGPIGKAVLKMTDKVGAWFEAQVDLAHEYGEAVLELVAQGLLGYSTGAVGHLVRREKVGKAYKFTVYPVGELSLTPIPAEPRNLVTLKQLQDFVKSVDLGTIKSKERKVDTVEDVVDRAEEILKAADKLKQLARGTTMNEEQRRRLAELKEKTELSADELKEFFDLSKLTDDEPAPDPEPEKDDSSETFKKDLDRLNKKIEDMQAAVLKAVGGKTVKSAGKNADDADEEIDEFESPTRVKLTRVLGSKEYRREFTKAVRGPLFSTGASRQAMSQMVKAALEVGTDSEGGYLAPTIHAQELVTPLKDASILRSAGARVISLPGMKQWKVPSMTPTTTVATVVAEEGTYPTREPTFGEVVFDPWKRGFISKSSEEMVLDSNFPVFEAILGPNAVQDFAAMENSLFTTGDAGAGNPQGVVTGATVGVTAASNAAITGDEIIELYHSLSYLYRSRAVWMMNDATIEYVRKLKNAGTTDYLWRPGIAEGHPDTILGRPVITNNSMATIATTAKTVLFGDLSYYWISDFAFGGFELLRLDELYAGTGQIGFRFGKRFDANVVLPEAIQVLQHPV